MVRGEEWTRWAAEVVLRPYWLPEALCRPRRGAPMYLPPAVTSWEGLVLHSIFVCFFNFISAVPLS
jgi:hypothetical protein